VSQEDVCKLWVALYPGFTDAYSKIRIPEQAGGLKQYAKKRLNYRIIGQCLAWFKDPLRRHFCMTCHNKKHTLAFRNLLQF